MRRDWGPYDRMEAEPAFLLESSFLVMNSELDIALGGAGGYLVTGIGKDSNFLLGGFLLVGYMWGSVGFVGTSSGDEFLDAPDGLRYYDGAVIEASGIRAGIDLVTGFNTKGISVEIGYRLLGQVNAWKYKVKDVESNTSSELPAEGFSSNPPQVRMNGFVARLGFKI